MPLPHDVGETGYRAKRRRGEAGPAAFCVAAALALGGCGGAGPLHLLSLEEPLVTGALPATRPPALGLDAPGLAQARPALDAALAAALDPLGPGAPVAWSHVESGAAGTVAAAAGPVVKDDLVCRRFRAETVAPGRPAARYAGEACRLSATAWRIESAAPELAEKAPGLPDDLMPDLSG